MEIGDRQGEGLNNLAGAYARLGQLDDAVRTTGGVKMIVTSA